MTQPYRYHRKTMVELIGNQWVDVTIAALVRFHAKSERDREDLLALLTSDIKHNQLEIILPRFDGGQPIQVHRIDITRHGDGEFGDPPTLTATIAFKQPAPCWVSGTVIGTEKLSSSTAESMIGKPLEALITHPYLPRDMVITKMISNNTGWNAEFKEQP